MRTICSREISTKKCRQQQVFDSDLKGSWHYNHVTFTPIAKKFMLYCRLIYMLSILCVRLTIKVKVGIPESFKVGWYPPPQKKLSRVTLSVALIYSVTNCEQQQQRILQRLKELPTQITTPLIWSVHVFHVSVVLTSLTLSKIKWTEVLLKEFQYSKSDLTWSYCH